MTRWMPGMDVRQRVVGCEGAGFRERQGRQAGRLHDRRRKNDKNKQIGNVINSRHDKASFGVVG